jgi:hypothetical protein
MNEVIIPTDNLESDQFGSDIHVHQDDKEVSDTQHRFRHAGTGFASKALQTAILAFLQRTDS